jgi:hypothetical protein
MKIGLIFLILGANFGALYGQYYELMKVSSAYSSSPETYASEFALQNLAIVSGIMILIPLITRLVNGSRLEIKFGKQVCFWNSFILFCISMLALITDMKEYSYIGAIGAIEYYFINKWLFVQDGTYTQTTNKHFYPDNTTVNYNQPVQSNNISETTTNVESQETVIPPETTNQSNDEKRFCTNCGKNIDKSWKFCNYCGNKLV